MIGITGFGVNANLLSGFGGITGGLSLNTSLNIGGLSMSMGMGIGMGADSTAFSGDALTGGISNFFHPLMGGGFGMPQCGSLNGMGMVPGMMSPMMAGQNQQQQMMMMMMMLLQMMMQLMQQQMGMGYGMPGFGNMPCFGSPIGMGMPGIGMPGFGGFPGMGIPGYGMPGGYGSPIGMIPPGGYSPAYPRGAPGGVTPGGAPSPTGIVAPNSGDAAVDLARKYLGQESWRIKGQMPNFTAAGGQTNNCADFVSASLESTGRLKGHFVNVRGLEQALIKQGYVRIPASQAKPGDVWINHSRGHTELVSGHGGTRTIGSNNDRPGHQVISERNKNPNSGVYYSLRR